MQEKSAMMGTLGLEKAATFNAKLSLPIHALEGHQLHLMFATRFEDLLFLYNQLHQLAMTGILIQVTAEVRLVL